MRARHRPSAPGAPFYHSSTLSTLLQQLHRAQMKVFHVSPCYKASIITDGAPRRGCWCSEEHPQEQWFVKTTVAQRTAWPWPSRHTFPRWLHLYSLVPAPGPCRWVRWHLGSSAWIPSPTSTLKAKQGWGTPAAKDTKGEICTWPEESTLSCQQCHVWGMSHSISLPMFSVTNTDLLCKNINKQYKQHEIQYHKMYPF